MSGVTLCSAMGAGGRVARIKTANERGGGRFFLQWSEFDLTKRTKPAGNPATTSGNHLGAAGRQLRDAIMEAYVVDDPASEALLLAVCRERDRAEEADELVREHGISYRDSAGRLHVNPFVRAGREARLAMTRAIRAMGLDLEPVRDRTGRPYGGGNAD
jgi:hypothetical protein